MGYQMLWASLGGGSTESEGIHWIFCGILICWGLLRLGGVPGIPRNPCYFLWNANFFGPSGAGGAMESVGILFGFFTEYQCLLASFGGVGPWNPKESLRFSMEYKSLWASLGG